MSETANQQLLQRARQGDQVALGELFTSMKDVAAALTGYLRDFRKYNSGRIADAFDCCI